MINLIIMPAIIVGLILGLIELFFVHQDEGGMGWLAHGLHAIPVMIILIFISMNLDWAFGLIGIKNSMLLTLGARILLGIIAIIKIQAAAAIAGRVGERMIHTLIIAILVVLAPYLWQYLLADISKQYIPWLK